MPSTVESRKRRVGVPLAACLSMVTASALLVVLPSTPAFAADSATVNGATTYQTIAGFGASEAFGQAAGVMNSSSAIQTQVLNLLYSPTSGAGLTVLRNEIGADSGNSIEPNNPGGPNAAPNYLSLAQTNQDQGQLWFAQQIKSRFGVTDIYGDAWSAPGYMKTNDSAVNGGQVCGTTGASCSSGDWRQAYANYLVQYAKDYAAAGVPLTYIGPSNEPNFSASYDSMTMSPAQMASDLDVLGPTVKSSGLSTQISCCAATGWPAAGQYAQAIEADPTALADTAVITGHGYSGAPTSPIPGWNKPSWETEWYGTDNAWDTAWDDNTADSGFTWAQNIYNGLTEANVSAYLYWWGSNDFGNSGDESLVQLYNGNVSAASRLWAFGNYSRYIHPGAVRIGASSGNSAVELSAYKNTDGSLAIVALNTSTNSDSISYSLANTAVANGATVTPYLTNGSNNIAAQSTTSVGGGSFTATIPGRSLVTYVIPGGTSTGGGGGFPSGYHQLVVANDSLCADVYGNSSASGAAIDQWACNGQSNQQFQFEPVSGGYGELQAQNSGQDISVANSSTAQGTADIVQQPVNGSAAGLWLPQQQSDGSWQFKNQNSGLCLDVYGNGSNQGQQLDQWPCKNAPDTNQDFNPR